MNIEVHKEGNTATLELSGTLTLGSGDGVLRNTFNDQLESGERFIVSVHACPQPIDGVANR